MDRPFARHGTQVAIALLALVVAACAVDNSSSSPSIQPATPGSASPSAVVVIPSTLATPTSEPTATDQPTLEKGDLRRVTFDPATLTIVALRNRISCNGIPRNRRSSAEPAVKMPWCSGWPRSKR